MYRIICLLSCWAALACAAPKPNVVLFFTDDQGYGDIGCFGAEGFKTPNLDRMAAEGMKFTDFYVNCSVCSGSRTALMTGCHYQRLSMAAVLFPRSNAGLHPDEVLIPEVLKPQGYATACIGKWHLGHLSPCLPTDQGFDYYFGVPYSNDMWIDPKAPIAKDCIFNKDVTLDIVRGGKTQRNWVPVLRNEEVVEYPVDQSTLTRRYTEETVKFITEHKDEPFFVYVPHTFPHKPLYVGEKFKGRTKSLFGDIMEEIDWSVGEVLKALEDNGIDDKTLVIFTTDNGPAVGSQGPLRGRKASGYEGGFRVPTLMRWPGQIPAGQVCGEVAATIDMLPTLAQLSGGTPGDRKIDGKNIWPLMKGEAGAKSPHAFYVTLHKSGGVRSGKWKYYPWSNGKDGRRKKPAKDAPKPPPGSRVQLYDLGTDIGETKNLAQDHPEQVAKMHQAFIELKSDIAKNKRPTAPLVRK